MEGELLGLRDMAQVCGLAVATWVSLYFASSLFTALFKAEGLAL